MQVDDQTTAADNVAVFPGTKPEPKSRPKARVKDPTNAARQRRHRAKKASSRRRAVTETVTPPVTVPTVTPPPTVTVTVTSRTDVTAYVAAVALAGAAAWFSVNGMVKLFPGSPQSVVAMAVSMEVAKLVTAGWLARSWRATAWIWRLALMAFIFGLAVINAAGVYAQLVAAHVGERGVAQSVVETQDVALAAKIEVAASRVADLDRQIGQLDAAVAAATQRGKATTGVSVMEGQRKARAALAGEREKAAGALASLKAERAAVAAQGRRIETEAAPITYVADLLGAGVGADGERAIRWLIALMVLCCDPLAIALTAATSARR
jgi:hypothetical protein